MVFISTLFCTFLSSHSHANLPLNGVATLSELGQEKYIAGLYSTDLSSSAQQLLTSKKPQVMEIRILTESISARRFKRMWIESIAINSSTSELQLHAENMARFNNSLNIKLKKNDIFTLSKTGNRIDILVNSIKLGTVEDAAFFTVLLRTWLGNVPPSSNFRANLLLAGQIANEELALYKSVRPTQSRVDSIQNAITAREEEIKRIEEEKARLAAAAREAEAQAKLREKQRQQKIAATPKPTPKVVKATPTPKPRNIQSLPTAAALDESIFDTGGGSSSDSIFEDSTDDNFSAESLLNEQMFYAHLSNYTQTFVRYPKKSREKGHEGSLLIKVTIDRNGKVLNKELVDKTKYDALNKEALKAVDRASPYPPVPSQIKGEEITFTFRLTFSMQSAKASTELAQRSR